MALADDVSALFGKGIDAYKDIEVSKNYATNDPWPATRALDGSAISQGGDGVNGVSAGTQQTVVVVALIAAALVLVVFLVRRG